MDTESVIKQIAGDDKELERILTCKTEYLQGNDNREIVANVLKSYNPPDISAVEVISGSLRNLGEYELLIKLYKIAHELYGIRTECNRTDLSECQYIKNLKKLDKLNNRFLKINAKIGKLISKSLKVEKHPHGQYEIA